MTLFNVALQLPNTEIPPDVREFILDANLRVTEFMKHRPKPLVGFFPSCFEMVYRALTEIANGRLAPGNTFCEWGSGFGVTASMAAMLGFDSYGIEIDPELCDVSRDLAKQHGLSVRFICGSFILYQTFYHANQWGKKVAAVHTPASLSELFHKK